MRTSYIEPIKCLPLANEKPSLLLSPQSNLLLYKINNCLNSSNSESEALKGALFLSFMYLYLFCFHQVPLPGAMQVPCSQSMVPTHGYCRSAAANQKRPHTPAQQISGVNRASYTGGILPRLQTSTHISKTYLPLE